MTVVAQGHRGYIEPGSPEHSRMITPSKVAAILGVSRWESPYRLWHRMKGLVPPEPPADAFDIGHDMESYAAARWLRRNPGWKLSPGEVQFQVPKDHYPFDALATIDRRASRGRWRKVVEVKIARNQTDLEAWGDDLSGDCPEDYAAQVLAQMMFVGATQPGMGWTHSADMLVVGPYFNERIYAIAYDASVASWIIDQCTQFYESLQSDTPPPLDDSVATYECLKAQHPDIEAGETVNLEPLDAADYLHAVDVEKRSKTAALGAKNAMLAVLGRAQYGKVGELVVARRQPNGRGGVSLYAGRGVTAEDIYEMAGSG